MELSLEKLRFPIGAFKPQNLYSYQEIKTAIAVIEQHPQALETAVEGLNDDQLDTPYRPSGWTVRQVVHHLADSHQNAYIRFKLAFTEAETPAINAYAEELWAELKDGKTAPIAMSLQLLKGLHQRWAMFLNELREADLQKGYYHPAKQRVVKLQEAIALYAWHCQHHVAHITTLRDLKGW